MTFYARLCGWTLARAHARSGDRIALAAYLGGSAKFDQAIAGFAETYADQNERDYAALQAAVKNGTAQATTEISADGFTPAWVRRPACPKGKIAVAVSDHGRGVLSMLGPAPGLQAVSSYRRKWLARDVVAVVLTTLLVPQGMAYAELAGLPPITGRRGPRSSGPGFRSCVTVVTGGLLVFLAPATAPHAAAGSPRPRLAL